MRLGTVQSVFQSTLPREERRTLRLGTQASHVYFNPRSHERSDQYDKVRFRVLLISIHAPTRGATRYKQSMNIQTIFQSTLPREERLYSSTLMIELMQISIHAPTRGATVTNFDPLAFGSISIHAPTRGATISYDDDFISILFQSTLPREERLKPVNLVGRLMRFQSTLPREERPDKVVVKAPTAVFQSTLPREERRDRRPPLFNIQRYFNPRSHERSDHDQL